MKEFPADFEERVKTDAFLGQPLLDALNTSAPTSLRLHPLKGKELFSDAVSIPWSPFGKWLTERPIFTLDPAFHAGAYYPQEAGSQFLAQILPQLNLPENPLMLDLCAAPGGKSTLILDYLNGKGMLVSNEIIPNRAKILKENLTKWGSFNAVVTNNAPSDFEKLPVQFDCVVIDAPCSGEGMFRKDLQSRQEWSAANVTMCSTRQQDILESIWSSVKPGGYIVYSTCTFNALENEENAQWILDHFPATVVDTSLPQAKKGRDNIGHYALPHQLDTEGFYVVVVQKSIGDAPVSKHQKKFKSALSVQPNQSMWTNFADFTDKTLLQWQNYQFVVPTLFQSEIFLLHHHLRVIKLGTELGEVSQKGIIPHESLLLDLHVLKTGNETLSLTEQEALKYLKGDTFPLTGEKGFQIVSYLGIPLGWIKHLGNRFNNMYPKEWRIRMRIDG